MLAFEYLVRTDESRILSPLGRGVSKTRCRTRYALGMFPVTRIGRSPYLGYRLKLSCDGGLVLAGCVAGSGISAIAPVRK